MVFFYLFLFFFSIGHHNKYFVRFVELFFLLSIIYIMVCKSAISTRALFCDFFLLFRLGSRKIVNFHCFQQDRRPNWNHQKKKKHLNYSYKIWSIHGQKADAKKKIVLYIYIVQIAQRFWHSRVVEFIPNNILITNSLRIFLFRIFLYSNVRLTRFIFHQSKKQNCFFFIIIVFCCCSLLFQYT